MSSQTTIVLDRLNYVPAGTNPAGITSWVNRDSGTQAGFSYLTQRVSFADKKRRTNKFDFRINVPVVYTTSDACGCVGDLNYENGGTFGFWFMPQASTAERLSVINRTMDAMAALRTSIENLDPAY